MALSQKEHLQELYHKFAYLKHHHNAELVLDPTMQDFDIDGLIPHREWKHTPFVNAREIIPPDQPEARGLGFTIFANVDSDHAADEITRCSRTGSIFYLNNSPIYWFSKKQGGVETSILSSEFSAMKQF